MNTTASGDYVGVHRKDFTYTEPPPTGYVPRHSWEETSFLYGYAPLVPLRIRIREQVIRRRPL
jgi:hypothetical protein